MNPEKKMKIPPTNSIFFRSLTLVSKLNSNNKTKNAQGLKASNPAMIMVKMGKDTLSESNSPRNGMESFVPSASEALLGTACLF